MGILQKCMILKMSIQDVLTFSECHRERKKIFTMELGKIKKVKLSSFTLPYILQDPIEMILWYPFIPVSTKFEHNEIEIQLHGDRMLRDIKRKC